MVCIIRFAMFCFGIFLFADCAPRNDRDLRQCAVFFFHYTFLLIINWLVVKNCTLFAHVCKFAGHCACSTELCFAPRNNRDLRQCAVIFFYYTFLLIIN